MNYIVLLIRIYNIFIPAFFSRHLKKLKRIKSRIQRFLKQFLIASKKFQITQYTFLAAFKEVIRKRCLKQLKYFSITNKFIFQGHTLFQTHDNLEHLAMMTRILGEFPSHIIRKTKTSFFQHGRLSWDWTLPSAKYASQHCRPLHQYRRCGPATLQGQEESIKLDLVSRMLEYDPSGRLTLAECLKHPFFDRLSSNSRLEDMSKHILRLQIQSDKQNIQEK